MLFYFRFIFKPVMMFDVKMFSILFCVWLSTYCSKVFSSDIVSSISTEQDLSNNLRNAEDKTSETNDLQLQNEHVTKEKVKGSHRVAIADETADISEHPYMAAILFRDDFWCAGVVIDTDRVLTAAHCLQLQYQNRFFREYVPMVSVRAGGALHQVEQILFHPNYDPATLAYNIAVLKLATNLSFSDDVQKIGYTRRRDLPLDSHVTFIGWGAGERSDDMVLQKITLPTYNIRDCQEIYGRDLVTSSNFCAGYITLLKNVCNHETGGPAILEGEVVGMLSFSHARCDVTDRPAVFSAVSRMLLWLDNLPNTTISGHGIEG